MTTAPSRLSLSPERRRLLEERLHQEGISRSATTMIVPREDPRAPVPLTVAQGRMWFLDRLLPDTSVYAIPAGLRVTGDFNVEALERACHEVVRRHESLRTVFAESDGEPFQVVLTQLEPEVVRCDLSGLPAQDGEKAWRNRMGALVARPFDLSRGPLLRIEILRIQPHEHVVLLSMHHIVSDLWSMRILMLELVGLYESFVSGRAAELAPLSVQYPDHALHQRQMYSAETARADLDFWVAALRDIPTETGLVLSHPRPAEKSYRGGSVPVELEAGLVRRLRDLGHTEGASLFMVLTTAFDLVLSRLSGHEDVVIGTPVANRPLVEQESLIGLFVNTLVLRTDLSGSPTVRELVRRVKDVCLAAYEHQAMPFERIVEELRPERSLAQAPLFQVMFTYQNVSMPAGIGGAVETEPITVEITTAKFDLTLNLLEDSDAVVGRVEYSADVFDEEFARSLARYLQRVLRSMVEDPDQLACDVPLLGEFERGNVLALGHGADRELPLAGGLHELVSRQAELRPGALAVRAGDRSLTYGELEASSNRLARVLRGRGVGTGSVVAICLDDGVDNVTAILAIWKAGGAYLPLDHAYPRERLAFLIANVQATFLVTTRALLDALPAKEQVGALVLDATDTVAELASQSSKTPEGPPVEPGQPAYIIHTSGSTGAPKGVQVVHRGLLSYVESVARAMGMGVPGERYALLQPPVTDLGNTMLFTSLTTGGELHVMDSDLVTEPAEVKSFVAERDIDYLKIVPSHLGALASAFPLADFLPAKTLILGGESTPPAMAQELVRAAGKRAVFNHYGPTETTVGVCTCLLTREHTDAGVVPLGKPLANTNLYVLDAQMAPVPLGVLGELYVGGAQLATGYVGQPELTAERFVSDPFTVDGARLYRTGDLVRWLPSGELVFQGRADDQVKVRGFRVEPGEVQDAVAAHADVGTAVVLACPDDNGEARLVAYVVPSPGITGDGLAARVREHLAGRLPAHLRPSAIIALDAIPLTANGKLDRGSLPDPVLARDELDTPYAAPRDDVEASIAGLCSDLLGVQRVGVHDSFFELGGHSLLAVQLAARISSAHGVQISMREFFANPTVAQLAARVEQGCPEEAIPRADRSGKLPVGFAQERLCVYQGLDVESSFHNVPTGLVLQGQLDEGVLLGALDALVGRHEPLRSRVVQQDGRWLQEVLTEGSWPVRRVDLSTEDPAHRGERLQALVEEERTHSFRLAVEPPVRCALVRMAEQEHVLLLVIHHLVTDNWSYGVLVQELTELYSAGVLGRAPTLPALDLQFADYVTWQRWMLDEGGQVEAERHWRQQLDGVSCLELTAPVHQRDAMATGHLESFVLDDAVTAGLRDLGRRKDATLFMVLLAAYDVLLSAYSGSDDILVAYPDSGRDRAETTPLVGYFINRLVARADLGADCSFEDLVAQVRDTVLNGYEHRGYPVWKLGERPEGERDPMRVMFNLLNAPIGDLELQGLTVSPLTTDTSYVFSEILGDIDSAAMADLGLIMREEQGQMRGMWLYSINALDATALSTVMRQWSPLLDLIIAEPRRGITSIRHLLRASGLPSPGAKAPHGKVRGHDA